MVTSAAVLRPFEGALHAVPCLGTLIAADPEGVGAKTIMSTAGGAFALTGLSVPSCGCGCRAALGIVAMLVAMVAGAGATRAAEPQSSSSVGFYAPIKAVELERYRAQGLTLPGSGDMTVGVILWDEYRRARQPRDTIDATGAHGATISLAASVHAR